MHGGDAPRHINRLKRKQGRAGETQVCRTPLFRSVNFRIICPLSELFVPPRRSDDFNHEGLLRDAFTMLSCAISVSLSLSHDRCFTSAMNLGSMAYKPFRIGSRLWS